MHCFHVVMENMRYTGDTVQGVHCCTSRLQVALLMAFDFSVSRSALRCMYQFNFTYTRHLHYLY